MSKRYTCHCCGSLIESDKPQDPERDRGYGTCADCAPAKVRDMVKCGFAGKDYTEAEAWARTNKYA